LFEERKKDESKRITFVWNPLTHLMCSLLTSFIYALTQREKKEKDSIEVP